FAYADPKAPKAGAVKLSAIGTFDTLNPFTLRGVPAAGLGQVFDTLMTNSADEAFAYYGLVAETVETPADRSWVAFTLRPQARFHDGSPMTVEDVIWTFETLKTKGHPLYRSYYAAVTKAEASGPRRVRFTFKVAMNRELPLIVGQLPVLSKAWWTGRDFGKTTLEPPLSTSSGRTHISSTAPTRAPRATSRTPSSRRAGSRATPSAPCSRRIAAAFPMRSSPRAIARRPRRRAGSARTS